MVDFIYPVVVYTVLPQFYFEEIAQELQFNVNRKLNSRFKRFCQLTETRENYENFQKSEVDQQPPENIGYR